MSLGPELASIDAHSHIAPDVTGPQLTALGRTVVFGMTRSLTEARAVYGRRDRNVVWGLGTHPGVPAALSEYDPDRFAKALDYFAVVGEVGLDRRGQQSEQREVFTSVLQQCQSRPVVISVHSTGRTKEVLECVERNPHPGLILHWFNGTQAEVKLAAELGCYFSINAAMDKATVAFMPSDRVLTETDFPSSRKRTKASKPGDTGAAESLVAEVHSTAPPRELVHTNMRALLDLTGVMQRLPKDVAEMLTP